MADIIKVKARKNYEWNQDPRYLYVQIPLPAHTSLKKVEIYLADLILRVTSTEKKQTHFLDLLHPIEHRSPDNKFVLTDGLLHATLRKANEQPWPALLIEDISLAELKTRRRESELRAEQEGKQAEEAKDKLRVEYDRKATQELMRFEQQEREKLDLRKQIEKEEAVRQVFAGIDEQTGRIAPPPAPAPKRLELQREEERWRAKEQAALQLLEKEEESERQGHSQQLKQRSENKIIQEVTKQYQRDRPSQAQTMFTEEDIARLDEMRDRVDQQQEEEEIPIRRGNNQKVAFTQRAYPNLAARDTFPQKEPPMPKAKTAKAAPGDLESKNPLWLKDKGDSFFRDRNYTAAVEAYSEAIRLDSKLTKAFLNRSLALLKLFRLQDAINDCDHSLSLLQLELPNSEEDQAHSRLTIAKIKSRKAICLAWKGEIPAARSLLQEVSELEVSEEVRGQVSSCLAQLERREQSLEHKLRGDEMVKLNNIPAALAQYERAILIDHNEYALSNKVLCLNKTKQHQQAIATATEAIKKIVRFNVSSTKEDKDSTLLLLKLHYRKAKAHEELAQLPEAEEEIRRGLTVSSEDKDLKQFLGTVRKKQAKATVRTQKETAASLVREGRVQEALQAYGRCLRLLEENEDVMEYLAILQNQCVCHQKLEHWDDVLSACIRILKLVNSIESKVLGFGRKEAPLDRDELRKITVRTLMRRANAYVKTAQLYNAKSDFEKALEVNQDEEVRRELTRLYDALKNELTK